MRPALPGGPMHRKERPAFQALPFYVFSFKDLMLLTEVFRPSLFWIDTVVCNCPERYFVNNLNFSLSDSPHSF